MSFKIRNIIVLFLFASTSWSFSQDYLELGYNGNRLSIEDPKDTIYIKFDTNSIWHFAIPNKQTLKLSDHPQFGDYALFTDTNNFYQSNVHSSFKFKLLIIDEGTQVYFINFFHKYDFEENKDGGVIETSWDMGISWQNIIFDSIINVNIYEKYNFYCELDSIASNPGEVGFTGLNSSGSYPSIGFFRDSSVIGDTLLLRFTFTSDPINSGNEGWMLDEFGFYGEVFWGVKQIQKESDFALYPNPATDLIQIHALHGNSINKIELISLTGNVLLVENNTNHLKLNGIDPGLYLIRINRVYTKKIIIEQ